MSSWNRASLRFSMPMPIRPPSQAPNSVATPTMREVDEGRHLDAERVEVPQRADADQAHDEADSAADDAVADDVERLEVVAGVDVLLLQAGFVARDHVDEEVRDPDLVQVVGDSVGAVERRRQIVKALHLLSPGCVVLCDGQRLRLVSASGFRASRGCSSPQNQASSPKANNEMAISANGRAGAQTGMGSDEPTACKTGSRPARGRRRWRRRSRAAIRAARRGSRATCNPAARA